MALAERTAPASAAEKKLIRAHRPEATDDEIREHRLTPEGLALLITIITSGARRYLDHQPETSAALDACPDDHTVAELVRTMTRHLRNAFASARDLSVSPYDVAAATITNASMLATKHGVGKEQLAVIHLEAILRTLPDSDF